MTLPTHIATPVSSGQQLLGILNVSFLEQNSNFYLCYTPSMYLSKLFPSPSLPAVADSGIRGIREWTSRWEISLSLSPSHTLTCAHTHTLSNCVPTIPPERQFKKLAFHTGGPEFGFMCQLHFHLQLPANVFKVKPPDGRPLPISPFCFKTNNQNFRSFDFSFPSAFNKV